MQKQFSILLFIAFFTVVSGCSDGKLKTEPVSGTITYKGAPLADATVGFTPKVAGEGNGGFARTNEKGFYQLQTTLGRADAGTTPGEYYVTVLKVELVGTKEDEMKSVPVIPEKYSSKTKSGLTATVTKGKNEFNFDLE